jgi:hypothetical protein
MIPKNTLVMAFDLQLFKRTGSVWLSVLKKTLPNMHFNIILLFKLHEPSERGCITKIVSVLIYLNACYVSSSSYSLPASPLNCIKHEA